MRSKRPCTPRSERRKESSRNLARPLQQNIKIILQHYHVSAFASETGALIASVQSSSLNEKSCTIPIIG
jgi:hypothetical protein